MKIKGILLATISLLGISGVFAQNVEYDDMYFNSKDREKLNAERSASFALNTKEKVRKLDNQDNQDEAEALNPTDTYSARNVNPEYISRSHTEAAQSDNEDYFVNNYRYQSNQLNNWNNNYTQWYNSPWYRNNYYGPGINSYNSPYYGYNSFNSPWYDPYWANTGWSSSFSFHYGQAYNYGWGGNYNYWNRPYYGYSGWDPYFGGSYYAGGYGGGYWNNYRYPSRIVIVNNGGESGRKVVYGKRATRDNTTISDGAGTRSRTSNSYYNGRTDNSSGRISTQNRRQQEYYNRSQSTTPSGAPANRSSMQNNRSRSWDNDTNGSWNNSSGRTSSPTYSPSQNSNSSGATRSSGSGTNGRSRGRD